MHLVGGRKPILTVLAFFAKLSVALVVLLLQTGSAKAQQTYFVSTTGSDSIGDGSSGNPWATIDHAIDAVPDDGSTILVRDGVYTGRTRIDRRFQQTLTVRAENAYRARLQEDSTSQRVISVFGGANFVLEGFEITRPSPSATAALIVQIQQENGVLAENITLRDNVLHDSYNNDILKINNGARNITVEGNLFYNQAGSDEHIDINGVENVVVQDNVFFNDFAGSGRTNSNNTSSFVVIKNSAALPFGGGSIVRRNLFLNWEGSTGNGFVLLGEDGQSFHEAEDVLVENNLMIGNASNTMRAPFGVKGGKDITFRNNTITGNLPANAYAMRLNREGQNPVNEDVRFFNNIWSDPTGTMNDFSDGDPSETTGEVLDNNVYWNGGGAIPTDGGVLNIFDDARAVEGDPKLSVPTSITPPRWTGSGFAGGYSSIREAFEQLVVAYAAPGPNSVVLGQSDPLQTPPDDILGRPRGSEPDVGAYDSGAVTDPCDLNADFTTNVQDVQAGVAQALKIEPCGGADLNLDGVCNIIDVQRIINATLGQGCTIGP